MSLFYRIYIGMSMEI